MKYYEPETKALSGLYDLLSSVAEDFPNKEFKQYINKDKQRIVSKLKSFSGEYNIWLSDNIKEILCPYPELSFDRLREILISAHERYLTLAAKRRDEWMAFTAHFQSSTKEALVRTINQGLSATFYLRIESSGSASFLSESVSSYRQTLYLENPVLSIKYIPQVFEMVDAEIDKHSRGYRISFIQNDDVVYVDFSDIQLETQLLNYASSYTADGSPWSQISDSLHALEQKKAVLGMMFLNSKEKDLLQLIEFSPLRGVHLPYSSSSDDKTTDEMFLRLAGRAGSKRVVALALQYSAAKIKVKKKKCQALVRELREPESENLIQLLLEEIADAAIPYLNAVELDVAHDVLVKTRAIITDILRQQSFTGEYPHFRKMASLNGVRLLETQGQPVFLFNEKYMACMIDCFELSIKSDIAGVYFTVSTVFLKKDELPIYNIMNGYSGFFRHKRRRARRLFFNLDFRDSHDLTADLKEFTMAVAKLSACEKLTKAEHGKFIAVGPGLYGCITYGVLFLSLGSIAGLILCLGMLVLAIVLGAPITAFSPEAPSFIDYIKIVLDFPWWQIILFSAIGFSLPLSIITAFARKRG